MITFKGLDFSVYQREISMANVRRFAERDFRVAVVGSWHGGSDNPYAEENLRKFRIHHTVEPVIDVGRFHTGTYMIVNAWHSPRESIERGVAACGNEWDSLSFAAIDVEQEGDVDTVLRAEEEILRRGGRPCLYTGGWVFGNGLIRGRLQDLTHIPLWYSHYSLSPGLDSTRDRRLPQPWKTIGHQYRGTHTVPGINFEIDANVFDAAWVADYGWKEGEDKMTDEEKRKMRELEEQVGRLTVENATVRNRRRASRLFGMLSEWADAGEKGPSWLRQQCRYLLADSGTIPE